MKVSQGMKAIVAASALLAGGNAYAATAAGTQVINTVTVDYQLGGVAQTQASTTATFKVDRKIDLTVVTQDANYVPIGVNQPAVLKFVVTNASNSPLDLELSALPATTGTANPTGFSPTQTDSFDTSGVTLYVDTNSNGTYDAGTDLPVTYLDEVAAGAARTVFLVSTAPGSGIADGDVAEYTLKARASLKYDGVTGDYVATAGQLANNAGGGYATNTNTGTPDVSTFTDTVLADAQASHGNTQYDGIAFDQDAYRVTAAAISVSKTSRVISDPVLGTSANAKAIPGAVVEYCITVTNNGSSAADTVAVADDLSTLTQIAFNSGSLVTGLGSAGTTCSSGGSSNTDIADADASEYGSGTKKVTAHWASLAGSGASAIVRFQVTIQ